MENHNQIYDLHIHTKYSDGELDIKTIVKKAQELGISGIAITDHDNIDSWEEIDKNSYDIPVLKGVEISTYHNEKVVHLLGYYLNNNGPYQELKLFLEKNMSDRITRLAKIIELLKKYDINITQEEILKEADGAVVRPHIVSAILKKYQDSIYTKDYLYEHYLGDNKPCFVPVNKTNTKDAIELLHRNNCIAIIAHPLYTDGLNFQDLLSLNIDGVECFYKYRFQTDNTVLKFAEQNNLLVTGGSDYHGPNIRDSMNEAYLEGEYVNKFLKRLNR